MQLVYAKITPFGFRIPWKVKEAKKVNASNSLKLQCFLVSTKNRTKVCICNRRGEKEDHKHYLFKTIVTSLQFNQI